MWALPAPVLRKSICGSAIKPEVTASPNIWIRCGHRMNNTPRIAAAATNTALFHIGSKPRTIPEKMNPGRDERRGSEVTTVCCGVSVCGGREAISFHLLQEFPLAWRNRRARRCSHWLVAGRTSLTVQSRSTRLVREIAYH